MTEELLPCPFCGGEAFIRQPARNEIIIRCHDCPAKMQQKVLHKSIEWLRVGMIQDWNKRDSRLFAQEEGK